MSAQHPVLPVNSYFPVGDYDLLGLTLWRPWAWCFTDADKRVENRPMAPWRRAIGCWIALHSGMKWDAEGVHRMMRGDFGVAATGVMEGGGYLHPHSMITGIAHLTGCVNLAEAQCTLPGDARPVQLQGNPWAFGPYCWLTPHVIKLPEPVRCRGAQGLWVLPPEVEEEVREQVARAGVIASGARRPGT